MGEAVGSLLHFGYLTLGLWVFAEQMGLPVPALPILLAAGALAAAGRANLSVVTAVALVAALSADFFWFFVGRRQGSRALGWLCRISLAPDSCVQRTRNFVEKHGLRSLLVAKFVPGLSSIAPPVVGAIGTPWWWFAAVDAMGSLLWIGVCELLGFAFSHQLEKIAAGARQMGVFITIVLAAGLLLTYIAQRYERRRRFLRGLRMARITPEELKQKMDRHELVTVVDLRHSLDFLPEPWIIPGAIRIPLGDLDQRSEEIPQDREIVLYCTCPNEASSALTAMKLRSHGITRVHPLQGGLHRWRDLGFPLESSLTPSQAAKALHEGVGCAGCRPSGS